jgi:DNA-binding GntR family transcriptional regulator
MSTARRTASAAGHRDRGPAPRRAIKAALPTLTDRAYDALEEMIVTLQLAPGSAASEAELSQWLGIGRTPIREALQRLSREKLVQILPRRGVIVSDINVKSQLRLLEVRREIDRLVSRSAARRATSAERGRFDALAAAFEGAARTNDDRAFMRTDHEFNELCVQASRNEFAAAAMRLMHPLSRRFWYVHYKQAADMPEAAKLHAAIARSIAAGDEDAAAAATDALLDNIEAFTRGTVGADT